jgi:hypothetical protein
MSNLSELLPTGGGQNAVDFVASGTLSSGQTVALKSDGTVEAVAETVVPESGGTPAAAASGNRTYNSLFVYHEALGQLIYIYLDGNRYPSASVCTLSGTTITFGTPVITNSNTSEALDALYMPNTESIVIAFRSTTFYQGYVQAGTATSSTTSWGGINSQGTNSLNPVLAYHATTGHVITYYEEDSNYDDTYLGKCKGYSVTGTTMTLQSTSNSLWGGSQAYGSSQAYGICYDSNINRIVVSGIVPVPPFFFTKVPKWNIVSYSGSFSVGANGNAVTSSTSAGRTGIHYDSTSQSVVYNYLLDANPTAFNVAAGTLSTTALTLGSYASLGTTYSASSLVSVITHDSNSGKNIAIFCGGSSPYPIYFRSFTTSGTSITLGNTVTVTSSTGGPPNRSSITAIPNFQLAISYENTTNDRRDYSIGQLSYTSTNNTSFIGITAEAISDTATGAVNVYGGINEAQTGLTIGSDYYVQNNGSISTTSSAVKIGQAISATTINMMDLT